MTTSSSTAAASSRAVTTRSRRTASTAGLKDEHYIGEGNAHVVSPSRAMEAGGDQMDYYGKEQGKAVITGNAWAVQENNTMRSNRMTIYLADDGSAKVK